MLRFNAVEKIIDKFKVTLWFNNHNKKIVNKNSPNYGTQNIADRIINKTELPQKNRDDIRELEIISISQRKYRVTATYSDGVKDNNFKAHWYGWQDIRGKSPLWTPLGFSHGIDLGQSRFISISAWVRDQPSEAGANRNTSKEILVGDRL